MTTRSLLALAALALTVSACGSDGPTGNDGGGNGSFTGTISGDISMSVTGEAMFGTSATNNSFGFVLGNDDAGIIFGRETTGLLGVGTHTVYDLVNGDEADAPASQLVGVIGITSGGTDHICFAQGGTVTVTSSTASRMTGSLNVTAECLAGEGQPPRAVTIAGTFTAIGGPASFR